MIQGTGRGLQTSVCVVATDTRRGVTGIAALGICHIFQAYVFKQRSINTVLMYDHCYNYMSKPCMHQTCLDDR